MEDTRGRPERTGLDCERLTCETPRLRLTALTAEALEAWLSADAAGLLETTGVAFEEPVDVPPLFSEDLPMFRDRMVEEPGDLGWWVWLVSRLDDGRPVGVCGLGGSPVDGGTMLGYSVYPRFEGRGYATEASRAIIEWVFDQPDASRIVATVPLDNAPSVAVARKLGMVEIGRDHDPEAGEVRVYEIRRT